MMPECTVLEAADGQQTHRLLKTHNINTLVLDINLAKESGLLLAADFLATQPNLKIIFFSMFEDCAILQRAMQTGAMGYISKSSPPDTLISAIKVVAKGQKYIERSLAVNLANQLLNADVDIAAKLTKRKVKYHSCRIYRAGNKTWLYWQGINFFSPPKVGAKSAYRIMVDWLQKYDYQMTQ